MSIRYGFRDILGKEKETRRIKGSGWQQTLYNKQPLSPPPNKPGSKNKLKSIAQQHLPGPDMTRGKECSYFLLLSS